MHTINCQYFPLLWEILYIYVKKVVSYIYRILGERQVYICSM